MSITYYASNRNLDYNFGSSAYSVPGTLYMGLSTSVIGNDGTGATEPSGGAYARVTVTNNKTNFGPAATGALTNLTSINFVESTTSWGTITYIFFADAISGGNIWYFQSLSPSKIVQAYTTVVFAASALTISMTN